MLVVDYGFLQLDFTHQGDGGSGKGKGGGHTIQNISADLSESVIFSITSPANL